VTAGGQGPDPHRLVIKVGSAQLIDPDTGAAREDRFAAIAADIATLRGEGAEIVLVSSGAVGLGRQRLKLDRAKSLTLPEKQAAAAAGQSILISQWDSAFQAHGLMAAQALLTPGDTEARRRWLNARDTLGALLGFGVIPVINENDTVATDELRFGDNDRLAARVAQMLGAQQLIILSDVDGLYDRPPEQKGARHLPHVAAITPQIEAMAGPGTGSAAGTGGMASKVAAARIAVAAGCTVVIARGDGEQPIRSVSAGARHTRFEAAQSPERARQAWIRGLRAGEAALQLDAGACAALRRGRSLLPAGVTGVRGDFERGAAVRLLTAEGVGFATGITRYDSEEARRIAGLNSADIDAVLGYRRSAVLVHADDLVLDEAERPGQGTSDDLRS
jgi:glutamate 5-kinase